jgi:caffeoyl-CoA O-methyltransferase
MNVDSAKQERADDAAAVDTAAFNSVKQVDSALVRGLISEKETVHGRRDMGVYVERHLREHPILRKVREHANSMGDLLAMQISADEGAVLQFLVRMLQARRCVEVGFFTGYSALAVALAMPDDGSITAIDINEEWAQVGEAFFTEAGVRHKLDLRIAPAVEALDGMISEGSAGAFDFGFIDADKANYAAYYERVLALLRPGGVLAIDNVFWLDRVADAEFQDADTRAIRALNDRIFADSRVEIAYLPTADGVALCYKK